MSQSTLVYEDLFPAECRFLCLYNYGAAILRAVGDTKRPLMFLVVAGVTNAVTEYDSGDRVSIWVLQVLPLRPVISQLISCILVLRCLYMTDSSYQLRFSRLCMKKFYLVQIFQVGIPAGVQSTVINYFQCAFAVFCKFLWFHCYGWLYGGE